MQINVLFGPERLDVGRLIAPPHASCGDSLSRTPFQRRPQTANQALHLTGGACS